MHQHQHSDKKSLTSCFTTWMTLGEIYSTKIWTRDLPVFMLHNVCTNTSTKSLTSCDTTGITASDRNLNDHPGFEPGTCLDLTWCMHQHQHKLIDLLLYNMNNTQWQIFTVHPGFEPGTYLSWFDIMHAPTPAQSHWPLAIQHEWQQVKEIPLNI